MRDFVACAVQIAVKPNDVEHNTAKAIEWLEKAVAEHGAELVVFPEDVTTGFTPNMPVEQMYEQLADTIPGDITRLVGAAARRLGVHVVWPMYEKGAASPIVYNSSALIGPDGEIIGVYRKTHPFPTERIEGGGWTTPGTEAPVFDTDLGKIGMIICYDGDFPELARELTLKGAEIITRPSAFLRSFDIWELTCRARAYDNHVYIIGVNAVGPDAGNNYFAGHSMIVSPIAQRLAQARGTEEIISAKLSAEPLKYITYGSKEPMIFDHVEDRNLKAVGGILQSGQCPFEPSRRIPYKK